MNEEQIEAMLERAAKKGAREALESIGLHDDCAVHDVTELRGLLASEKLEQKKAKIMLEVVKQQLE
jgi:2-iminoacetate synthase ThiH